jgi:hypothetical protein
MRKLFTRGSLLALTSLVSASAFAVSPYDPITAAVDWTDVGTAVIAVAALVAAVLVTIRGVKFVLGAVRR